MIVRCAKKGYKASDETIALFEQHRDMILPAIDRYARSKVKARPELRLIFDASDVSQELSVAVLSALSRYDDRQELSHFLSATIKRAFSKLVRDAYRGKRMPKIQAEIDGEKKMVVCPTISINARCDSRDENVVDLESSFPNPEEAHQQVEDGQWRDHAIALVRQELRSEDQILIFDCYTKPPPALLVLARNLTGHPHFTPSHIAMFLGMPISKVSYLIRKIRASALVVAERLGVNHDVDTADL